MELRELSVGELFELDVEITVSLSDIYANVERQEDVERMRIHMKAYGLVKTLGFSMTRGSVHVVLVGDKGHPQHAQIYAYLEEISVKIHEASYVPNMTSFLHYVNKEEKEMTLRIYSEKLAIAFGVMNFVHGSTIQVIKNLRICRDCHATLKFITKIVNREIVIIDSKCFHHFKDGLQS